MLEDTGDVSILESYPFMTETVMPLAGGSNIALEAASFGRVVDLPSAGVRRGAGSVGILLG